MQVTYPLGNRISVHLLSPLLSPESSPQSMQSRVQSPGFVVSPIRVIRTTG